MMTAITEMRFKKNTAISLSLSLMLRAWHYLLFWYSMCRLSPKGHMTPCFYLHPNNLTPLAIIHSTASDTLSPSP